MDERNKLSDGAAWGMPYACFCNQVTVRTEMRALALNRFAGFALAQFLTNIFKMNKIMRHLPPLRTYGLFAPRSCE